MKRPERSRLVHPARARCDGRPRRRRYRDGRLGTVVSGELGWLEPDGPRRSATLLLDEEQGIIKLMSDDVPEGSIELAVRLTWPVATAWIQVTLLSKRRMRIGPTEVRLVPRRMVDSVAIASLLGQGARQN